MKKVIYFTDGDGVKPFMFVKAYRKKSLLKRENVQLSYFVHELDIDDEMTERIISLVKRHYPNAKVNCETVDTFEQAMYKYRYHVVCKHIPNGDFYGFDSGCTSEGEVAWTMEIENAQLHYDQASAEESARAISSHTGECVTLTSVYIAKVNPLSEQEFIIHCKSKKSGRVQFYSRTEGTRLRLVRTSDAAAKFNYSQALSMFDELKAKNKAFFYTVMPYIENVNCADLEQMYKENKIPVAINMTDKLKWMGRE